MKLVISVTGIMLLALAIAGIANAKIDIRNKDLDAQAKMVQHAKSAHQQKIILLQHPEKMEKLSSQYEAIRKDSMHAKTHRRGQQTKERFYQKTLPHSEYKHNCPYRKGLPN